MLVAIYRRHEGNRQFFDKEESEDESFEEGDGRGGWVRKTRRTVVVKKKFRTSGNSVLLLMALSLASYISLMVLIWRLDSSGG